MNRNNQKVSTGRKNFEQFRDGRDEMNLIEFPIATLSERSNGSNVLEFQKQCYDRTLGKPVVRKLTVTGDAKHGLPTAKDEEVYLGLIQLTKVKNDFQDAAVMFTRSELIKLLGWKNRDWSYHRINKAFCRLTGVRLFYENAWRDNSKKSFCNQGGFALLDSFQIRDGRRRSIVRDESERLSEFRWNHVLFDSFQSGYLKKLDYSKVRQLSAIARRAYRYLDKHFYPPHRPSLSYDLKTFAFEHIGISRRNDSAQIRRSLAKPIEELERIGFLAPEPKRFSKVAHQRGVWEVRFTMGGYRKKSPTRSNRPATKQHRPERRTQPDFIDRRIQELSPGELHSLEIEALSQASDFQKDIVERNGPLAKECRRQLVRAVLLQRQKKRS